MANFKSFFELLLSISKSREKVGRGGGMDGTSASVTRAAWSLTMSRKGVTGAVPSTAVGSTVITWHKGFF